MAKLGPRLSKSSSKTISGLDLVLAERGYPKTKVHRRPEICELRTNPLAIQPAHLQATPEALSRGVDAPMSRDGCRVGQVSQNQWVQLADDVALEAAMDFLFRQPLRRAPGDVFQGARIASHSDHGNGPQGVASTNPGIYANCYPHSLEYAYRTAGRKFDLNLEE